MYKRIIKLLFETQRGGQRGMGKPDSGERRRKSDAEKLPIDQPVVKPKPETSEYKPIGGRGKTPNQPAGQTMKSSPNLDLIKQAIKTRKEEADARKKAEKDKLNRRKTRNRGGSL